MAYRETVKINQNSTKIVKINNLFHNDLKANRQNQSINQNPEKHVTSSKITAKDTH